MERRGEKGELPQKHQAEMESQSRVFLAFFFLLYLYSRVNPLGGAVSGPLALPHLAMKFVIAGWGRGNFS